MKRIPLLFLAAFYLLTPAYSFAQDEADKALALVRKAYASLEGLKANFVQTEERPGVGVRVREEGIFFFKPPDRMRWNYQGKRPHAVFINSSKIWIHTPGRNQVVLRNLNPREMRSGAATFLSGLDGIEEDFTVQSRPTVAGEDIPLDLFPHQDNLPYDKIAILVAPDTGLLKRIAIYNKLGNVTTITFKDIETDATLKDDLFKWDIPEGTEVIEP